MVAQRGVEEWVKGVVEGAEEEEVLHRNIGSAISWMAYCRISYRPYRSPWTYQASSTWRSRTLTMSPPIPGSTPTNRQSPYPVSPSLSIRLAVYLTVRTGSPRLWSPPALPTRVVPDSGRTFVDQNGFRLGPHALVPLFAAADALSARTGHTLEWGTVDVVTDRNNLLKLLAWLDVGCAKRKHRGAFRIDVALAGAWTLLLRRWEERPAVSSDGTGFGDGFERMCSKDEFGGGTRGTLAGHQRVVTYVSRNDRLRESC